MANKRMFSLSVVDTDAFLEMPQSSQLLYFHLSMRADDEGFVSSPQKIKKMVGSGDDDYRVLIAKKFIIPFESGVCVIKHWLIHNTVRLDRFSGTNYIKEKSQLLVKDNKAYKLINIVEEQGLNSGKPNGNQLATQVKLSEVKLSKKNSETSSERFTPLGAEVIKLFEKINPVCKNYYNRPVQRKACEDLIKQYSFERLKIVIEQTLPKTNKISYFPTITTPLQLMEKWVSLESAVIKYQNKVKSKENYII